VLFLVHRYHPFVRADACEHTLGNAFAIFVVRDSNSRPRIPIDLAITFRYQFLLHSGFFCNFLDLLRHAFNGLLCNFLDLLGHGTFAKHRCLAVSMRPDNLGIGEDSCRDPRGLGSDEFLIIDFGQTIFPTFITLEAETSIFLRNVSAHFNGLSIRIKRLPGSELHSNQIVEV